MEQMLKGVRILDLSRATGGPFATLILADLGAEIIKIEAPPEASAGLSTRDVVFPEAIYKGIDLYFFCLNRDKKSIGLNLRHQKGKEMFLELVKKSDVVFDNFRSGVLNKMGIDYNSLKKLNPRIISCSLTGFGSSGPLSDESAFDAIIQAYSGIMHHINQRDVEGRLLWPGIAFADLNGAMMASGAILGALYAREHTGKGRRVEVSMLDVQLSVLIIDAVFQLNLNKKYEGSRMLWGGYETEDDYIVVAIQRDRFWRNFCKALNREEWITDERFNTIPKRKEKREELSSLIEEVLKTKPINKWLKIFKENNVPHAPLLTIQQAVLHPHAQQSMIISLSHPEYGEIKVTGNPIKEPEVEQAHRWAPSLGEHTNEVLSELLGYNTQKIEELRKGNIIF